MANQNDWRATRPGQREFKAPIWQPSHSMLPAICQVDHWGLGTARGARTEVAARKLRPAKEAGYPLVVFLHGKGGDVMSPNEPWQWQANSFSSDSNYRKRPCFVIAPQNPDQRGWNGAKADGPAFARGALW